MTNNSQYLQVINQIGVSYRREQLCYIYLGVAVVACAGAYVAYQKYIRVNEEKNSLSRKIDEHKETIDRQSDIIIFNKKLLAALRNSKPDESTSKDKPLPPTA